MHIRLSEILNCAEGRLKKTLPFTRVEYISRPLVETIHAVFCSGSRTVKYGKL